MYPFYQMCQIFIKFGKYVSMLFRVGKWRRWTISIISYLKAPLTCLGVYLFEVALESYYKEYP